MADTLREIGAQMANVMFNLAQRPGDALTGDHVATMDSLRKQWDAAVRATPPSPSTGPRKFHVKDHVVREVVNSLRDTALEFHGHQSLRERLAAALDPLLPSPSTAPEGTVTDYGTPVDERHEFERWMSQRGESAVYIGDGLYSTGAVCDQAEAFAAGIAVARAALASRPAEVDDEGLPPLPEPRAIRAGHGFPKVYALGYTEDQFRQGQRDAVAADRARRDEELKNRGNAMSNWLYGLSKAALPYESWAKKCAALSKSWDELAAPSHTTNKENGKRQEREGD